MLGPEFNSRLLHQYNIIQDLETPLLGMIPPLPEYGQGYEWYPTSADVEETQPVQEKQNNTSRRRRRRTTYKGNQGNPQ